MDGFSIKVNNISKVYQIGRIHQRHDTLRDSIVDGLKGSARRLSDKFYRKSSSDNTNNRNREDELWALKDISFNVNSGEVIGVIGRNGAGKSTLLKILSRITEPTSGRAIINGRIGSLLEVGTGFHPELTGRENIYLNGAILGMKRTEIERKFDEIVTFAEIEKFLDTPVKRYSSGMYVRLAFAVAAHLETEILLIDEVLAVGDAAFQKKCLGKMGEVTHVGRTILFVSHDLYSIQTICQKVIWIDSGQIRAFGPTNSVTSKYKQEVSLLSGGSQYFLDKDSDEARIKNVRINDQTSQYITLVGKFNLKVEWDFEITEPISISLGVSLSKGNEHYICGLGTHLEGTTFHVQPGFYTVGVSLPDLNLSSGTYRVQLAIMEAMGSYAYCYRYQAATLYVETPFQFDGLISLEHQWIFPNTLLEMKEETIGIV